MAASLWLLTPTVAAAALPPEPWRDPDLGQVVVEGAATSDRLWLLGGSGAVVEFERATGERRRIAEDVIDILHEGGRLWSVAAGADGVARVRDLLDPASDESAPAIGAPRALFSGPDGLGLVSTGGVARRGADGWAGVPLTDPLAHGGVSAAAVAGGKLYVGLNAGEWGGGLRLIDLATGRSEIVGEHAAGSCDGVLSVECDPVADLFADPSRAGCIIAAAGLAHLSLSDGWVLRVCDGSVEALQRGPAYPGAMSGMPDRHLALTGLWPAASGWIGTREGRLLQPHDRLIDDMERPPLREWAGLRINDDDPEFLVVLRSCCHGSVSDGLYEVLLAPIVR
jgi:hypothetical protein